MKNFSLAKATAWCCGTGATMNILNYFYGSNFSLHDTDNIKKMIRFGKSEENMQPSEFEIALFLAKNNFKIQYYSPSEQWDFELLATNSKKHQEKYNYEFFPLMDVDSHLQAISELFSCKNFSLFEWENQDFRKIIEQHSDNKHCFIFMPDYFLIHNFPNPENRNGWHIMMSTGFDNNSWKIQLFESTPNTPDALFQNNPDYIFRTFEELQNCMYWDFFIISENK